MKVLHLRDAAAEHKRTLGVLDNERCTRCPAEQVSRGGGGLTKSHDAPGRTGIYVTRWTKVQ